MRQALGLRGTPPPGPRGQPERNGSPARQRPPDSGAAHRRHRFVQDGEVPVVHVSRRLESGEQPPQSSRINTLEAANQAERSARERAERALHATQMAMHEMRTKLGHTELALAEAQAQARQRASEIADLKEAVSRRESRLLTLQESLAETERKAADAIVALANEKLARLADQAQSGHSTSGRTGTGRRKGATSATAAEQLPLLAVAAKPLERKKKGAYDEMAPEPEPVKWWLTSSKAQPKRWKG